MLRLHYPKSFLRLQWAGFLLVALPALLVLAWVWLVLDDFAAASREQVAQAARLSSLSHRFSEWSLSSERRARQFLVLRDRHSFDRYQNSRARAQKILELLEKDASPMLALKLEAWRDWDMRLDRLMQHKNAKTSEFTQVFSKISTLNSEIVHAASQQIDAQAQWLLTQIEGEKRLLSWFLGGVVGAAFLLALAFSLLSSRLLEQLSVAIRNLGAGKLREPIVIAGSKDFRFLGEQLEWLRARLVALETEKAQFLRQMSSEFHAPLTALGEGILLLNDTSLGELNATQGETVRLLHKNNQELQQLIEFLLAYHLAQSRPRDLFFSHCALQDFFQILHTEARAVLGEHCHLMTPKTPLVVRANREQLSLMLWYLFLNRYEALMSKNEPQSPKIDENNSKITEVSPKENSENTSDFPKMSAGNIVFSAKAYRHWAHIECCCVQALGGENRMDLAIVREYALQHGGEMTRLMQGQLLILRLSLPLAEEQ